ncbi:hypothetical protein KS461_01175 [Pseudomonas chlororaphis]|nr:hypothetical protein [Pseudomonas chlororaphis]UVE45926.1 hypothetical protein KS461_01175 [Pseudomonas chlororaphis]
MLAVVLVFSDQLLPGAAAFAAEVAEGVVAAFALVAVERSAQFVTLR